MLINLLILVKVVNLLLEVISLWEDNPDNLDNLDKEGLEDKVDLEDKGVKVAKVFIVDKDNKDK